MGRSDLSRHALEQAKRGERVHPLHDGDKPPASGAGSHRPQPTRRSSWWSKWPDSNVGIVVARGEAFVDIDTPQAKVEFQKRVSVAGAPMVHTPSGGWHVLYRGELPNRVLIHNGGRPLEVKGPGSNRVAPGSVTAKGEYRLLLDASKPPAPDELIRWIEDTRAGRKRDARVGRGDLIDRAIFKGERNMVMFKLAAFMRRAGINSEGIEAALLVHNRSSCHPPLAESEVTRIAESAAAYPAGSEWALDPQGYANQIAAAYGLRGTAQAVLTALYRGANDRGLVTRGVRRLASETRLDKGTVSSAIEELGRVEVMEVVKVDRQYGTTYRVLDPLSRPLAQPLSGGGERKGGPSVRESIHPLAEKGGPTGQDLYHLGEEREAA